MLLATRVLNSWKELYIHTYMSDLNSPLEKYIIIYIYTYIVFEKSDIIQDVLVVLEKLISFHNLITWPILIQIFAASVK